ALPRLRAYPGGQSRRREWKAQVLLLVCPYPQSPLVTMLGLFAWSDLRIRFPSDAPLITCLGAGRLKDTLHVGIQPCVELRIGLLGRQSLNQRPRKARHNAVIPAQAVVGFVPRIPTRQRHHPHDIGMTDTRSIEIVLLRERELEHDQPITWQVVK